MRTWPCTDDDSINRHLQQLHVRRPRTIIVYRCILVGFQRFVIKHKCESSVGQPTIEAWLHDRAAQWPMHLVLHRTRIVDRFLDFLANEGAIPASPLFQLRVRYGQRTSSPVVRALLAPEPEAALDMLRPQPRFASFLGELMRNHIELMQALGARYNTQAARFLRFDRFLQGRLDLAEQPLAVLLQQWAIVNPTVEHAWECDELGRNLAKAWRRVDQTVTTPSPNRHLKHEVERLRRRPYIYTPEEIRHLLDIALQFPSPCSPLRPLTLYTMLVLAYCAGLRISEIVHLDLGDVNLNDGEIAIRDTKFFKSRILPLSNSALAALGEFLDARRLAGAPQHGSSGLFWHEQHSGRYSQVMTEKLLVRVLRRAGMKPDTGRVGPRIHDLRHAFVVNRMLTWYREGINPQTRLPYLATYLGHKDINSTLVYLTITQELLQQASERFRAFGVSNLHADEGERS
jgi:integrase/recombinase XerD